MSKQTYKFSKKVGKVIKAERTKLGLSQEKLAELSEISPNSVGNIERGTSSPTLEMLNKIAKGLKVNVVDLVNTDENYL